MDRKIVLKQNILDALSAVGMRVGQTVMVHCSLSALGYVRGGSQPVIDALLQAVGETGTIMMPTQSWKTDDTPKVAAFSACPTVVIRRRRITSSRPSVSFPTTKTR